LYSIFNNRSENVLGASLHDCYIEGGFGVVR
jgi:hypothetical protein